MGEDPYKELSIALRNLGIAFALFCTAVGVLLGVIAFLVLPKIMEAL